MALTLSANSARTSGSQARRAHRLPPLRLDPHSPPPVYIACPTDEKAGELPCIIVTPSSPCHDTEFQIHYFAPEKPTRRSWFPWFSSSNSNGEIALPLNPEGHYAQYQPPSYCSSKTRWLRMILLLAIPLFILFHLFLIPGAETHMMEVLSPLHHHQDTEFVAPALTWDSNGFSPEEDQHTSLVWDMDTPAPATVDSTSTKGHATETTNVDDLPTAPASNTGSTPQDTKDPQTPQTGEL